MTPAELTSLLTVLTEFGVTKYSCGDLSVELGKPAGNDDLSVPETLSPTEIALRKLGKNYHQLVKAE